MIEAPARTQFGDRVMTVAELRDLIEEPRGLVIKKQLPALDPHCRAFIATSPFMLLGTTNDADGNCDVSPRGDAPGFVLVLDERTLAIPDRPGNRRIDSLRNIITNPAVGLLFLIPGVEETLRVNGRAYITRDEGLRARLVARGKAPELAIVVEVAETFLHCAKAFKRSELWNPATWPDRAAIPTLAQMICDQLQITDTTPEAMEASFQEAYRTRLY